MSAPLRQGLIVVPASTAAAPNNVAWEAARAAMRSLNVAAIPASMRVEVGLQTFLNAWLEAADQLTHVAVPIAEAPPAFKPHPYVARATQEFGDDVCATCGRDQSDLTIHIPGVSS